MIDILINSASKKLTNRDYSVHMLSKHLTDNELDKLCNEFPEYNIIQGYMGKNTNNIHLIFYKR